jgi:hypothetical protein
MGVAMIAEAKQLYDGKVLRRGDRFAVKDEAEARDLIAMHFATRDSVASEEDPEPRPSRGRYQRRDMRATKSEE